MSDDEQIPEPSPPPADEALLFRADVGGRLRAYDPFRVGRLLSRELQGEKVSDLIGKTLGERRLDAEGKPFHVVTDDAAAFEAGERLFAAARVAFDLPAVAADGSGFTESAVGRVLRSFLKWKSCVKKNFASSPTS